MTFKIHPNFVKTLTAPEQIIIKAESTVTREVNLIVDHYFATSGGYAPEERPKETVWVTLSQVEAADLIRALAEALKEANQ